MKEFSPRKTVTIRVKGSDISVLARQLENDFTKEAVRKMLESFTHLFDSCNVVSSTMIVSETVPELLYRTATKKAELSAVLAALLSSREILEIYLADMPEGAVKIYRTVYSDIYVSVRKAEEIYGHPIGSIRKNRSWNSYYAPMGGLDLDQEFSMLKSDTFGGWGTGTNGIYLIMPPSIRQILGPLLMPTAQDVPVLQEYTPGKGETLYSVQNEVEPLYPVLHSLYLSGILEMGKTKVTATTLKRISRQAAFREFFPDSRDKLDKNLAGTLITSLFCMNAAHSLSGRKAVPDPVNIVARHIIGYLRNSTAEVLSFYSGILLSKSYQNVFLLPAFSNLVKDYLDILAAYASEKWLMAPGIMAALRNESDSTSIIVPFNVNSLINYSICNQFSSKYLTPSNAITQFTRPLIELLTASLAALGLAEIVYGQAEEMAPSPMAGLKAVRLTSLGRYALGLTDNYSSGLAERGPLFDFDSQRLLLQTVGENNPYEVILTKYLIPVGDHRFRATAENFIDGCDNERDLLRKIANFKLLAGDSLPEVWEAFFNDLVRKCGAFTPVTDGYRIFRVNPDDTELIAAITDDPAFRDIVVCAEGFMLLVKTTDFGKFSLAMRRHGYIV